MEKKNVEKEKSNGEILFTSFVLTAYANVTTCRAFYTSRGHVASSSSPKSVGQVVFVVFVLLLYDSLSLSLSVSASASSSKFKLPAVIFLIPCPFLGHPFYLNRKNFHAQPAGLAFSSPYFMTSCNAKCLSLLKV